MLKTNRPEILPPDGSHKKVSASQRVGGGSSVRQPGIVVKSFCAKVSILYRRNIHCTLPNGEQNPIDFSSQCRGAMNSIVFEKVDNYARITLNRPPLNIMNIEMMSEICETLESLHNEDHVKLIVFSSACKVFSAGVDMADHTPQKVFQLLEPFTRSSSPSVKLENPRWQR